MPGLFQIITILMVKTSLKQRPLLGKLEVIPRKKGCLVTLYKTHLSKVDD